MDVNVAEALAQIVSAVGVLATLVYLAIQIRQSSTVSRANIRQELAAQQIEMLRVVALDPVLRNAMRKHFSGEEASQDEGFALLQHAMSALRLFESCHAQWEYGTLSDEDWDPILRRYAKMLTREPYARAFAYQDFNPRFAALVSSLPDLHAAAKELPGVISLPAASTS